jgi:hypothetical protein
VQDVWLSFMALDVEGTWPMVGAPARTLITQAVGAIAAVPQQPIIYTDPGDWEDPSGVTPVDYDVFDPTLFP